MTPLTNCICFLIAMKSTNSSLVNCKCLELLTLLFF
uniref:Uncharacterized protein n=1 Tax=Arundo donax TaxID=35708 RepID=A0A0A9BDH7_ARUDO